MKMKKLLFAIITGAYIFAGCGSQGSQEQAEASTPEAIQISIEELVSNTTDYGDKLVEVSGVIDHFCRNSGDKFLVKEESGLSLMVRLGEKKDQFTVDFEGTMIKVSGVFKYEVTNKDELGAEEHLHAEDEDHDCESEAAAMEALRERGIDPTIIRFLLIRDYEIL
jgi:hypothetical protein